MTEGRATDGPSDQATLSDAQSAPPPVQSVHAAPLAALQAEPSVVGVGTIVWLASELMFFAGLFAAYFTLRSVSDGWPPGDVDLPVARTALATLILISSSYTMHRAVAAVHRRDDYLTRRTAITWLGVTILLGVVFLGNQALEYAEASFKMDDHAYGSIFYLLTGFHGLHVLAGLVIMVAVAALLSSSGLAVPEPAEGPTRAQRMLDTCGYYWHFVDAIWVVLFITVYLLK